MSKKKKNKNKKDVGWCNIPPTILARKDLKLSEKVLVGRILGLIKQEGFCWAQNKWLGEAIGLAPKTVGNLLRNLENKNLIKREVIRGENNEYIDRKIYPTGVLTPDRGGPPGKVGTPPPGKMDNNTDIMNTDKKFNKKSSETDKEQNGKGSAETSKADDISPYEGLTWDEWLKVRRAEYRRPNASHGLSHPSSKFLQLLYKPVDEGGYGLTPEEIKDAEKYLDVAKPAVMWILDTNPNSTPETLRKKIKEAKEAKESGS